MKLGLLILATVATTGGLASVHVSGPSTRDPSSALLFASQVSSLPAPILPAVAQLPPDTEKKAHLEMRRPPVPIVMKPHRPIEAPASDMALISAAQPRSDTTKSAATGLIEADGYKSVRVVSQSQDGRWHAKALRGATEVLVTVDAQGNVSAD